MHRACRFGAWRLTTPASETAVVRSKLSCLDHREATLRAGVELKWGPVKRVVEWAAVEQRELGRAQSRIGAGSRVQFVVEMVHELFSRCVRYLPKSGDHVVGSGSQESPGESD